MMVFFSFDVTEKTFSLRSNLKHERGYYFTWKQRGQYDHAQAMIRNRVYSVILNVQSSVPRRSANNEHVNRLIHLNDKQIVIAVKLRFNQVTD